MAEVGNAAPEFKLKSHDGSEVSLTLYRARARRRPEADVAAGSP